MFEKFTMRVLLQANAPSKIMKQGLLERTYNPIIAMGFSVMFTFQLDNTKR